MLHEETEAENEGAKISLVIIIGWLGRPSEVKARSREGATASLTDVFAVKRGGVFNCLLKSELQQPGRRYEVEVFKKTRPDALCGSCNG